MKSLGVIETVGLVAAVQAVDAACKAAEVTCFGYRKVGAGRVSVCFEGEISAVKTAVERGVAVVGNSASISSLVIARPEPSAIEALRTLKGRDARPAEASSTNVPELAPQVALPPEPAVIAPGEPDKANAKKGKKA
jgi:microcompartment protein CcmL/EutN